MKARYDRAMGAIIAMIYMLFQATGCSYITSSASIEALTEETQVETFYGEGKLSIYIDDEIVQKAEVQEWKGKNKKYHSKNQIATKQEFFKEYYNEEILENMIKGDWVMMWEEDTINDDQLVIYLPHKEQYSIKNLSLADEVKNNVRTGADKMLETGSFKDYVMQRIDEYEQDYILTIKNDVRVNNYLTQQVTATHKDTNKHDKITLWIDQYSWVIVKEVIDIGNYRYEYEYTKTELNPNIDEEIFEIDIPKDKEVQYLDSDLKIRNEEVTIDEAVELLGVPIFYIKEDDVKLMEIHYIESIDTQYGRVELIYETNDGNQFIIENTPAYGLYEKIKLEHDKVQVRDIEANYIETSNVKGIEFTEEGTICDIYIKNSELSKEELIQLANKLELKANKE